MIKAVIACKNNDLLVKTAHLVLYLKAKVKELEVKKCVITV